MDFGVVLQNDPAGLPGSSSSSVQAETYGFTHAWTFDSHLLWQEPYVVYSQYSLRKRAKSSSGRWSPIRPPATGR